MTIHMADIAEQPIDERHLRNALGRFATGVTVITTRAPSGKPEGLTANSFTAVSLHPPLVSWSLKRAAPSYAGFLAADHFAVNILAADQLALCRHFATPLADKFAGIPHADGLHGAPILAGCLASFDCRTETTIEGGDHQIFIGRVMRATYRDGEPLIFSAGRLCLPALIVETTPAGPDGFLSENWEGL
ncbi:MULTISPECIES: flavin reductase family protein [Rhodomicrobium]|uniref:flavin reductase family protein n=1 Tax=Rhodomicrobium TaxID=1068 RepID=UPI000B4B840D|nr:MULTISPECIES: flavin reductase family protein [Rhodomicrobium]